MNKQELELADLRKRRRRYNSSHLMMMFVGAHVFGAAQFAVKGDFTNAAIFFALGVAFAVLGRPR